MKSQRGRFCSKGRKPSRGVYTKSEREMCRSKRSPDDQSGSEKGGRRGTWGGDSWVMRCLGMFGGLGR